MGFRIRVSGLAELFVSCVSPQPMMAALRIQTTRRLLRTPNPEPPAPCLLPTAYFFPGGPALAGNSLVNDLKNATKSARSCPVSQRG